ncbi:MAG: (2Fe-2S) ferredoxin domain-containing protein [Rikenellaceae bacterium]
MILKVCIGSSCHLKGSYDVINGLKELLKKYDLEDVIDLQASFCLSNCANGVTAKVEEVGICECPPNVTIEEDGSILLHRLCSESIEEIFVTSILPLIKK